MLSMVVLNLWRLLLHRVIGKNSIIGHCVVIENLVGIFLEVSFNSLSVWVP